MPNALLVYPEIPPSYWGMQFALNLIGKKALMPPLGLLTVASLFPSDYVLQVVDMNVTTLTDAHLQWADMVLTSTMVVQKASLHDVIERCNRAGVPIVAGGPYPTTYHGEINEGFPMGGGVDYFILGEAEEIFPSFLQDWSSGTAHKFYTSAQKPDVTYTPLPRYDLIHLDDYASMPLQFSRGCPFDCEFCDITKLFGRVPRTKSPEQMITEFDLLYRLGWRSSVFVVDDNFIGNKRDAMRLLADVATWQEQKGYPFTLYTEASVNLVEIPGMLTAMRRAGFDMVFLGIESPNEDALVATNKKQNTRKTETSNQYLLRAVRQIQEHGIEVTAGFIIGLDGDVEFDSHLQFIQEAGIPMAMVGLLSALKGTNLYHRLAQEGRLLGESTGNNTDITLNFVPALPRERLVAAYREVLVALYDPTLKSYFDRCWTLLKYWRPAGYGGRNISRVDVLAFCRSLQKQLFSKQGPAYLWFFLKVVSRRPKMLAEAARLAILGYHFERITSESMKAEGL